MTTTETLELFPGVQFRKNLQVSGDNKWEYLQPYLAGDDMPSSWLPACDRFGSDHVLDQLAEVTHQRGVLAQAIADAGFEAGHIEAGHRLSGPQLLLILADMVTMLKRGAEVQAAIADPQRVFENMKAGSIAKISLRSAIDLHGEVINGDDAQQLEIASLRAQVEELRQPAARYNWLRERDLDTIHDGGVFAGLTPDNVVINGEDLDNAIDAAIRCALPITDAERKCHDPHCWLCEGTGRVIGVELCDLNGDKAV